MCQMGKQLQSRNMIAKHPWVGTMPRLGDGKHAILNVLGRVRSLKMMHQLLTMRTSPLQPRIKPRRSQKSQLRCRLMLLKEVPHLCWPHLHPQSHRSHLAVQWNLEWWEAARPMGRIMCRLMRASGKQPAEKLPSKWTRPLRRLIQVPVFWGTLVWRTLGIPATWTPYYSVWQTLGHWGTSSWVCRPIFYYAVGTVVSTLANPQSLGGLRPSGEGRRIAYNIHYLFGFGILVIGPGCPTGNLQCPFQT